MEPGPGQRPAVRQHERLAFLGGLLFNNHNEWDLYWPGVGTRLGLIGRAIGGAFGAGDHVRINEAYDRLCAAWAAGDHTIDIVGFSRGAAMTLDLCHLIQTRKIRNPGTNTIVEPSPTIRFLGVWDIVAAFGIANLGATDLNIGHHLVLPKTNVRYAFHALALDERRPSFLPTRLHGACEVWFRGAHSDVGGGNQNRGLNDIGLKWMMRKAKAAGLPITAADVDALEPNPFAPPHLDPALHLDIRLVTAVDRVHYTVLPVAQCRDVPGTCSVETDEDEQNAAEVGAQGARGAARRRARSHQRAHGNGAGPRFPARRRLRGPPHPRPGAHPARDKRSATGGRAPRCRQADARHGAKRPAGQLARH